jgi:hypothetical protein
MCGILLLRETTAGPGRAGPAERTPGQHLSGQPGRMGRLGLRHPSRQGAGMPWRTSWTCRVAREALPSAVVLWWAMTESWQVAGRALAVGPG